MSSIVSRPWRSSSARDGPRRHSERSTAAPPASSCEPATSFSARCGRRRPVLGHGLRVLGHGLLTVSPRVLGHGQETVSLLPLTLLGHGLLAVSRNSTKGLRWTLRETFGRRRGTVRRPCPNRGRPCPNRGRPCPNRGRRGTVRRPCPNSRPSSPTRP